MKFENDLLKSELPIRKHKSLAGSTGTSFKTRLPVKDFGHSVLKVHAAAMGWPRWAGWVGRAAERGTLFFAARGERPLFVKAATQPGVARSRARSAAGCKASWDTNARARGFQTLSTR